MKKPNKKEILENFKQNVARLEHHLPIHSEVMLNHVVELVLDFLLTEEEKIEWIKSFPDTGLTCGEILSGIGTLSGLLLDLQIPDNDYRRLLRALFEMLRESDANLTVEQIKKWNDHTFKIWD